MILGVSSRPLIIMRSLIVAHSVKSFFSASSQESACGFFRQSRYERCPSEGLKNYHLKIKPSLFWAQWPEKVLARYWAIEAGNFWNLSRLQSKRGQFDKACSIAVSNWRDVIIVWLKVWYIFPLKPFGECVNWRDKFNRGMSIPKRKKSRWLIRMISLTFRNPSHI